MEPFTEAIFCRKPKTKAASVGGSVSALSHTVPTPPVRSSDDKIERYWRRTTLSS
jgi:hypothetical protein